MAITQTALTRDFKKPKLKKLTALDVELAMVNYINPRINLIVPNVFWGLGFNYELDLISVTNSYYATEIEIKVSLADVKKDKDKKFWAHKDNRIKYLFFAIPDYLYDKAVEHIPERAGIFVVNQDLRVDIRRGAEFNKNVNKLTDKEYLHLLKLASMRTWKLKKDIKRLKQEIDRLKGEK